MSEKLLVPDIGDFDKVEIIELLVKVGDEIKINDLIITIESDKSSVEIPSTISGKIKSINVKVGDKVSKGDLILNIETNDLSKTKKKTIPKNTENLIIEAEKALNKNEKTNLQIKDNIIRSTGSEKTQLLNNDDIDPLETQDWIESLSAVVAKDGNQRAHFLI